ncbi:MAG: signal transduction histidine kinase [Saprospiraceae bacterium]|jgi:signal transduction histidine kinase
METNTEAILFLNALVSKMDIGVIAYDMEGFITLINSKATNYLGIPEKIDKLVDTDILSHFDIPVLADHIKSCIHKTRTDFHLANVNYNDRYLIIDGKKLLDGMLLSISDITANVLAKNEATQSLLLGQEMERRRLAKEIHDGVGPSMSTLKLQIDAVKRKAESDKVVSGLEEINKSISAIASDIRQISHDLMPSSLIDFGVVTALSNFAKKITESSDIEVHYQSNIKDSQLTKEYELNIYRIVQELVNNALKYSQSKNIEISLRIDDKHISILVQDDGIGMDMRKSSEGIGLQNIKTRVISLHGDMDIDSQLGSGVTTYIDLPVQ